MERLAVVTGVSSHWLSTGIGDPNDPEQPEKPKEPVANATMLTHVTVVPEVDWYEVTGKQQLCSFMISYKGLDQTSTRQPDIHTSGVCGLWITGS